MSIANRGGVPAAPAPCPMPPSGVGSSDRFDSWSAPRRRAFLIVPYALLALLAACTAILDPSPTRSLVTSLALCAVAAAWMLWMVTLHPAWRLRPRVMGVFVAGLIVITALMVVHESFFGFFVPVPYMFSFGLLEWPWRLAGVSAVAVIAATAQTAGANRDTAVGLTVYFAAIAINVLPMNGLTWFLHNSENWHRWRQRTIEDLSEANDKLAATLAENAGLHEQLVTQAREAGVLDERQRMAREIHDTLAQGLTGIITQLQAAEQAEARGAAEQAEARGAADGSGQAAADWRRHVQAATRLARESLSEARRSVDALRPEPLETARLGEALADVARRWSVLHGVEVQVMTTGTVRPLHADAEVALLRTAQEALANVAKHARASRVGLTLSYMDHEVALDVRDDGLGFDLGGNVAHGAPGGNGTAEAQVNGGFGLVAMRQRIEGLHGTLQIESEPGGGTAVSACLPAAPIGAQA
jgi:signal transduction histidine kinase